jgi:hypothetical protein
MKTLRKTAKICLVIGLVLVISLIISPYFSGNAGQFSGPASQNSSPDENFTFYVYNNDMNRTHMVQIFVYNSSHRVQTEGLYEMAKGNRSMISLETRVYRPAPCDLSYSVTFIVDGNISSHYEQMAGASACFESYFLEPEGGVIRPFDLWCANRASDPMDPSVNLVLIPSHPPENISSEVAVYSYEEPARSISIPGDKIGSVP